MARKRLNKRAQLTLFIIMGILIVVGIIFIFSFKPSLDIFRGSSKNPTEEVKKCMTKSLEDVLPEFIEHGFYFNPKNAGQTLLYSGDKPTPMEIPYHCYTDQKNKICYRGNAQSKSRIEKELKNKIFQNIDECFSIFEKDNKGLNVEIGELDLSIEVLSERIMIRAKRDVTISLDGESPATYRDFVSSINSPLGDYIYLSNEILNQEVSCKCGRESCTADITNLMRDNIDYTITYFTGSRGERVYTLGNYLSETKFNFAVRNCIRV